MHPLLGPPSTEALGHNCPPAPQPCPLSQLQAAEKLAQQLTLEFSHWVGECLWQQNVSGQDVMIRPHGDLPIHRSLEQFSQRGF